jgi:ankyrin repeat protein
MDENLKVEIVRLLLIAGANINSRDTNGMTAFARACRSDYLLIVKFLLSVKSFDELDFQMDSNGNTILHYVNSRRMFLLLIRTQGKKYLNTTNNKGQTPLHCASSAHNRQLVKEIIEANCTLLNKQDNEGNTALHIACNNDQCYIARELIYASENNSFYLENNQGLKPYQSICFCSSDRCLELVQILIKYDHTIKIPIPANLYSSGVLTLLKMHHKDPLRAKELIMHGVQMKHSDWWCF